MTTLSSEARQLVQLDDEGRLEMNLACVKCGYNLRTLLLDAACPECGTAVGRSVEGNRLRYCDPRWLRTIGRGLNWLALGAVTWALLIGTTVWAELSGTYSEPPLLLLAIGIATGVVLPLVGFYWASKPDPARIETERWFSARRMARFCLASVVVMFMLVVLVFPLHAHGWVSMAWAGDWLLWLMLALLVGAFVFTLAHAAHLAFRLPAPWLGRVTWLVNVFAIVCLFGVLVLENDWFDAVIDMSWRMRSRIIDELSAGLVASLAALVLLVGWYWWAMRRAALHAERTWARQG